MRPSLFWHVFTMEARKQMSYRADFWLSTFVGLIAGIVIPYFLWDTIFAASGESRIRGYTFEGILIYYIVAVLLAIEAIRDDGLEFHLHSVFLGSRPPAPRDASELP